MSELTKLTACIIDDEIFARDMLKQMLLKYTAHIEILGEAEDVDSAISLIKKTKPDIVFLDIEMPDGNGFDVLQATEHLQLHVIFVTAYNDYALRAIKFHAFDYLLKPLSRRDLIKTVEDLGRFIDQTSDKLLLENLQNNLKEEDSTRHSIAISNNSTTTFLPINSIIRCQADRSYTRLYLENGKELFTSKNLGEFEKVLPSDTHGSLVFYRIHHSELINLKYIKSFDKKSYRLKLSNGNELLVAQRRRADFIKILAKFHVSF